MSDTELRKAIKNNPETGDYWDCPHCWWEGPEATIDMEEWVMLCPECDEVIDDRAREQMKENGVL